MAISVSTCGSSYDTLLLLGTAADFNTGPAAPGSASLAAPLSNDDDRGCASSASTSRIDADVRGGTTYFIVVDGYNGASGAYMLSVTCVSGCGGDAAAGQPVAVV